MRGKLKDYNKSPLHNGNNVKANCDINKMPEVRVFQYLYWPFNIRV